jgi:hypothetical protein
MAEIQSIGRVRQYVSAARLYAMFPLLRYSYERGAYVLRFVGESHGPVLRKDRRRARLQYAGPDRRAGAVDPAVASRPMGGVRRIEVAAKAPRPQPRKPDATRHGAEGGDASRRRRQHGRQRPPRPHR